MSSDWFHLCRLAGRQLCCLTCSQSRPIQISSAQTMDGFELLRRAKDVVVGLGDAYDYGKKLPGRFCQFDRATG